MGKIKRIFDRRKIKVYTHNGRFIKEIAKKDAETLLKSFLAQPFEEKSIKLRAFYTVNEKERLRKVV